MALIDIGPPAINRPDTWPSGWTLLAKDNPANGTGSLATVWVWSDSNMEGCKVGTFYRSGGAGAYTCRDFATVGVVTAGAAREFAVEIEVEIDDIIGLTCTAGRVERNNTGFAGLWYKSGDHFEDGEQSYGSTTGAISVYGEGATPIVVHEKEITEGIKVGEAVVKNPIMFYTEGIAIGEVLTKLITKAPFVEGIAIGEAVSKLTSRVLTEGIAIGEAVSKLTSRVHTEGIAVGEVVVKMRVIQAVCTLSPFRLLDSLRNKLKGRQL